MTSNIRHFNKHLQTALNMLFENELDQELPSFHAAIIVSGGNIISRAFNQPNKTGFVRAYAHHDFCHVHAELNAVAKCRKKTDLTGSKLFVARLDRRMIIGNSRPCKMCEQIMRQYGIKRVFYTLDKVSFGTMKL